MIIATRTLHIATSPTTQKNFDVRIFCPVKDKASWHCRYEIDWPGGIRKSASHGVDGVQALNLAMNKIGVEIYTSSYHASGDLFFDKPGNGYGFPVPKPMRDQLIGDDAIFDGN